MVAWVPPASRNEEIGREMFISVGQSLPATDIYYDAAGVQAVIDTSITAAKFGAPWGPSARTRPRCRRRGA
jgi:hypothetical protein